MKDKLFIICFYSFLAVLTIFFIALILSIIPQLYGATPIRGISNKEILFSVKLTLFTATISSAIAMLFSIPIGYMLARYNFIMKNIIDAILYLPLVISPIALGAMMLIFFNTPMGRFFENKFYAFRKIILPIGGKGLISAFLLTWARAVGEFGATVTLAGATTMKTETLPVAIYLSFASADIYSVCILILISLSISLSILFFIRKLYARSQR